MTAKELIDKISEYPMDAEIEIDCCYEYNCHNIYDIDYYEDGNLIIICCDEY